MEEMVECGGFGSDISSIICVTVALSSCHKNCMTSSSADVINVEDGDLGNPNIRATTLPLMQNPFILGIAAVFLGLYLVKYI